MAKQSVIQDLEFDQLRSYQEVLKDLNEKKRSKHLLMGNGFSMAYDSGIFSYNALYDFIEKLEDPVLSKLFEVINTKNFEQIMRQLDNFIEIAQALGGNDKLVDQLYAANELLQKSLIDAVSALHPEHAFEMTESQSQGCFKFLSEYLDNGQKVFSTNYDLLLYWVLMRNESKTAVDGFGKELLNPGDLRYGDEPEYDDLYWGKYKDEQSVFHLHGTLPIFDTGTEIEKEVYKNRKYLLTNIKERMDRKDYPVFVTAGDGQEKLKQIYHNRYLTFCYENLSQLTGSLVTYGFGFGEYDKHIINAINRAAKYGARRGDKLLSVYIGIYSESGLDWIKKIESEFKCKVNVYNARTVNAWG